MVWMSPVLAASGSMCERKACLQSVTKLLDLPVMPVREVRTRMIRWRGSEQKSEELAKYRVTATVLPSDTPASPAAPLQLRAEPKVQA